MYSRHCVQYNKAINGRPNAWPGRYAAEAFKNLIVLIVVYHMRLFGISFLIICSFQLVACTSAESQESADSIASIIRDLENKRLNALVEADSVTANLLHATDFQLVNPSGRIYTKEQYLGGIASGQLDYTIFRPDSEIQVRVHDNTAVIRYKSILEITVSGQYYPPTSFWHTDTYELTDGQWQVVWSQATTIVE